MIWISTYATRLRKLEVLKRRACGQLGVFIELLIRPHFTGSMVYWV